MMTSSGIMSPCQSILLAFRKASTQGSTVQAPVIDGYFRSGLWKAVGGPWMWTKYSYCFSNVTIQNIFICCSGIDIKNAMFCISVLALRICVGETVVQWISISQMLLEIQWKRCFSWNLRHGDVNFYSLSPLFILRSSRARQRCAAKKACLFSLNLFFLSSLHPPFLSPHSTNLSSLFFRDAVTKPAQARLYGMSKQCVIYNYPSGINHQGAKKGACSSNCVIFIIIFYAFSQDATVMLVCARLSGWKHSVLWKQVIFSQPTGSCFMAPERQTNFHAEIVAYVVTQLTADTVSERLHFLCQSCTWTIKVSLYEIMG